MVPLNAKVNVTSSSFNQPKSGAKTNKIPVKLKVGSPIKKSPIQPNNKNLSPEKS